MPKSEAFKPVKPNRREFLKLSGLAAASVIGKSALPTDIAAAAESLPIPKSYNSMPTRNLGLTRPVSHLNFAQLTDHLALLSIECSMQQSFQ